MKYCIHCGDNIPKIAKFCSQCGQVCEVIPAKPNKVFGPNNNYLDYAMYYYNLGLNITCISDIKNKYNSKADNIYLKAPNHLWQHLNDVRQELSEISSYTWGDAIGLGVVTGYDNLVVLDLDKTSVDFLKLTLSSLNLPPDYEWVVSSGSGTGYHIYFFISEYISDFPEVAVIRHFPIDRYKAQNEKTEVLIRLHSILPPSLHPAGGTYSFIIDGMPQQQPIFINKGLFQKYIDQFFDESKRKVMNKYKREDGVKPNFLQRITRVFS